TAVADRALERVARLVLVASSVPQDARSVIDVAAPWLRSLVDAALKTTEDARVLPIPPADELGRHVALSDMSDADRRWFWANAARRPDDGLVAGVLADECPAHGGVLRDPSRGRL